MPLEACLTPKELSRLAFCQVSEEEIGPFLDHVVGCSRCETFLDELEQKAATTVLDTTSPRHSYEDEPELQQTLNAVWSFPGDLGNAPPAFVPSPEFEPVGEYDILSVLGKGGMGMVFLAQHRLLSQFRAIKTLTTNGLNADEIARFLDEMKSLAELDHQNIVKAYDAREQGGQYYLVMEMIVGKDLGKIVRELGPLPVDIACEVVLQAARGLHYAHGKKLIHRDIKPMNLILGWPAQDVNLDLDMEHQSTPPIVRILDLGIARRQSEDRGLTSGMIIGTVDYMAPEQAINSHSVDQRADIYSLGAVLFTLLTGEVIYGGAKYQSNNRSEVIERKLGALRDLNPTPSIRARLPTIPKPLAKIVDRMLSKARADRFGNLGEVIQELQPFSAGADLSGLRKSLSDDPSPKAIVPVRKVAPQASSTPPRSHELASEPVRKVVPNTGPTPPGSRGLAGWLLGGFALLAAILIVTKRGTIEIDGTVPADVKVAISKEGELVEVLQADNHWRASVAGGEVHLTLQGGNDRFELDKSRLTISRFGKNVLTIRAKVIRPEGPKAAPIDPQPPRPDPPEPPEPNRGRVTAGPDVTVLFPQGGIAGPLKAGTEVRQRVDSKPTSSGKILIDVPGQEARFPDGVLISEDRVLFSQEVR